MKKQDIWKKYHDAEVEKIHLFSKDYMNFLNQGKTERECIDTIVNEIEEKGYQELETLIKKNQSLKAGDKVYSVWMNKAIVMYQIGTKDLTEGMNILGAHIDSPRMDLKQKPLFEDEFHSFAMMETHYYGGIKKYQWVTIPLALHGVIVKKNGETVIVHIGEKEDDPVFFISDLLIHLAGNQLEKNGAKVVEGEALDLIVGSIPFLPDDASPEEVKNVKERLKQNVLRILKEQYDIEEEDFISAEIEVVPAGNAREAGFDRSMIMGYGQDDRVCAYTSYQAMLAVENPERTSCCILVDKEEIGSVGATGMQSRFFENSLAEVMNLCGCYSELNLRRTLAHSDMLSSDVSAAFDPTYYTCFERKNTAYLGSGMVFNKYTGARGKNGSNDANAEYIAHIRDIMEKEEIMIQTAELGKVDQGGGGTIAYILALYGMNVIDSGVAVLNMHSPWEVTSKADVYEIYKGYMAFLKHACL